MGITATPSTFRAGLVACDLFCRAELGTERDRPRWLGFLQDTAQHAGEYVQAHARKVEAVLTRQIVSNGEKTSLDEIEALIESTHTKRVPTVTNGVVIGVISRADLVRALAKVLEQDEPVAPGDAALCRRVTAEMRQQPWGGRSQVTVLVTDGIVYLEGHVFDVRERKAMRVVAENVAGVKLVCDHLDYVDPSLGMVYGA